jgi:subtilase family serine protease
MNNPNSVSKSGHPDPNTSHEVFIAIKPLNTEIMEKIVLERGTPGTATYQKWLSFKEVGSIIRNQEAYDNITAWLQENGVEVTWSNPHLTFLKGNAPVSTWERLLSTKFYLWQSKQEAHVTYTRSEDYSIPTELAPYIKAIFNTCQLPPKIYSHVIHKPVPSSSSSSLSDDWFASRLRFKDVSEPNKMKVQSTGVTVSYLNQYYKVPKNKGMYVQNDFIVISVFCIPTSLQLRSL